MDPVMTNHKFAAGSPPFGVCAQKELTKNKRGVTKTKLVLAPIVLRTSHFAPRLRKALLITPPAGGAGDTYYKSTVHLLQDLSFI